MSKLIKKKIKKILISRNSKGGNEGTKSKYVTEEFRKYLLLKFALQYVSGVFVVLPMAVRYLYQVRCGRGVMVCICQAFSSALFGKYRRHVYNAKHLSPKFCVHNTLMFASFKTGEHPIRTGSKLQQVGDVFVLYSSNIYIERLCKHTATTIQQML